MKRKQVWLLVFLVGICSQCTSTFNLTENHETRCQNPQGYRGSCIPLRDCPELLALVTLRPLPNSTLAYLQSSKCGFQDNHPFVCCRGYTAPMTTRSPTTTHTHTQTQTHTHTQTPTHTQVQIPNRLRTQTEIPMQTLTQAQTQITTTKPWSTSVRPPKDVTKHRNVHLINSDMCGKGTSPRIIQGDKTGVFEFPWMTMLAYRLGRRVNLSFRCGGTVINERYILTAAHCISHTNELNLVSVRVGEHDTSKEEDCEERAGTVMCAPPPQNIEIERSIPHPQYSPSDLNYDVALLRLAQPIEIRENVKPICLPVGLATQTKTYKKKKMLVAGWGATGPRESSSPDLMKAFVPIVQVLDCHRIFHRNFSLNINARQICAGGSTSGQDSCQGDSGGPLKTFGIVNGEISMMQVGIVSYGTKRCATEGVPAVYTNVGHYMDWILDNMEE